MTQKWYATLRHPKMHPHTKFGIPTSKNIGDMHLTRSATDGHTDGLTDRRTVRLLYASQSSFGGIKRDKMRGLLSILSLFRNEFNKFNNTRARMLDSVYHMTNSLKSHFRRKNVMILSLCTQRCMDVITFPVNR